MSSIVCALARGPTIGLVCALALVATQTGDAGRDEAFALRYLLGVPSPEFWITKPTGEKSYDTLAEYKAWSQVYIRARDAAGRNDDRSLRLLLFTTFVAEHRKDAALSEALSTDLYPIVTPRRAAVFKILSELPFLARSTCHYLRSYHGFENRNRETRAAAMADLTKEATAALPPDASRPCVEELRR